MIISITSNENCELVKEAIQEAELNVLKQIVDEKFSLNSFIKTQLESLQAITIIIVDLSSLIDEDKEILATFDTIRQLYSKIKIIVIAPGRKEGDGLLSEIFSLGIYDIIVFENEERDNYLIKREIKNSLKPGKTYKDSVRFKGNNQVKEINHNDSSAIQAVKERIIIQKETKQNVNKALIGFAGTMERIGVTNNAIVSANFLKEKGYRVSVVESSSNTRKCFEYIQETFSDLEYESKEFFTLNHIDYYKDFPLEDLPKIILKNYNFIIIDFGDFTENILPEFRRCVMQIIVTGSKGWELENINKVFQATEELERKEYNFLFNFTHQRDKDDIRENMCELKKVYFSGYSPDPYNPDYYPDLNKIFKEYISTTEVKEQKKPFLEGMLNKFEVFKKK